MSHRNPYLLPSAIVAGTIALCWFAGRYDAHRQQQAEWAAADVPLVIEMPADDLQANLVDSQSVPVTPPLAIEDLPASESPAHTQLANNDVAAPGTDAVPFEPAGQVFHDVPENLDLPSSKAAAAASETTPAEVASESGWAANWKRNRFYGQPSASTGGGSASSGDFPLQPKRSRPLVEADDQVMPQTASEAVAAGRSKGAPPAATPNGTHWEAQTAPSDSGPAVAAREWASRVTADSNLRIGDVESQPSETRVSVSTDAAVKTTTEDAEPVLAESVLHKAVHRIEYGKSLARRGSLMSARREFLAALELLAQARDEAAGTRRYTEALQVAVTAIDESRDFHVPDRSRQDAELVSRALSGHSTRAIAPEEAATLSPITAMQRYYLVAQRNLPVAAGRNPVSAEALYSLGRLHTVMSEQPQGDPLNLAQAFVFLRASLAADRNHYRCSNELGVLLARTGEKDEAKLLFQESLRVKQLPATWRNLAKLHQELGEEKYARLAFDEYQLALQQPSERTVDPAIQWKSPQEFNAEPPISQRETLAERPAETGEKSDKKMWRGLRLF